MLHPQATRNPQENLCLEPCPEAVQVMPPETPKGRALFVLEVCGNVLMGALVLAISLMLPVLLAGMAPLH